MKPASMTVKEWLIKKLSIKLVVSEKVIDAVVTHQFDAANDAVNLCNSIEISGFGKFMFNMRRGHKQMESFLKVKEGYEETLADETISNTVRSNTEMRLKTLLGNIKSLKPKLK